jgi:hypothetical protein
LNENDQNPADPSGFCELLYNGKKISVLAKRTKKFRLSDKAEDATSFFIQYNQYFICEDGKYYPVNTEGDLMNTFGSNAQDVKKYMRAKRLKFKKNAEQAILTAVTFYSGLIN